jgi:hypothetical protein
MRYFVILHIPEVGAGMGGPRVPHEAPSGLLVGLPAASSQDLLQMRRLKAAEHRLMSWKEFLDFACPALTLEISLGDLDVGCWHR